MLFNDAGPDKFFRDNLYLSVFNSVAETPKINFTVKLNRQCKTRHKCWVLFMNFTPVSLLATDGPLAWFPKYEELPAQVSHIYQKVDDPDTNLRKHIPSREVCTFPAWSFFTGATCKKLLLKDPVLPSSFGSSRANFITGVSSLTNYISPAKNLACYLHEWLD